MSDIDDVDAMIVEHLDYLYRLAFRLTGCKHSAEDIVQDLFVNLKPQEVDVDFVKNKKAWLGTILYRTFVKYWRKEKQSPFVISFDTVEQSDGHYFQDKFACMQPGPQEQKCNANLQDALIHALEKLNEDHRVLVVMHDVEGYTLQELQSIMGVPIGTLKSRLHRARNKLQSLLYAHQDRKRPTYSTEKCIAHEV